MGNFIPSFWFKCKKIVGEEKGKKLTRQSFTNDQTVWQQAAKTVSRPSLRDAHTIQMNLLHFLLEKFINLSNNCKNV